MAKGTALTSLPFLVFSMSCCSLPVEEEEEEHEKTEKESRAKDRTKHA